MLAESFLLAWSLTHFACAVMKPDIVSSMFSNKVTPLQTACFLSGVGAITMFSIALNLRPLYFCLGAFEVVSSVASITNNLVWHVNEDNEPNTMVQVTMGLLQQAAAVAFFSKSW